MANDMLLINEAFDGAFEIDLKESNLDKGIIKFKGKFQEAEAVNKNKRMYPYAVLDENVQRLQEVIGKRGLVGELDHPSDSIIHFKDSSHVITKLWWDGNVLMGEGEVLTTPHGRVLQALLNCGVRVGISSRGVGNGKVNEDGILVIGESYRLITFDAVADPSTFSAFQEKVIGSKREAYVPRENSTKTVTRNESSSIHKLSKEVVIAAFGGVAKSHANKIINELRSPKRG
jgi:Prohead core protein serine protease